MPSRNTNGKNGRDPGYWLEYLLDKHPGLVAFVLVLVVAFAMLEPFLAPGLPYDVQGTVEKAWQALMNLVSAGSVLLAIYAIHQATSFRNADAAQKREDDKRATERYQRILDELMKENKKKMGTGLPRGEVGKKNEDKIPPTDDSVLSVDDKTV